MHVLLFLVFVAVSGNSLLLRMSGARGKALVLDRSVASLRRYNVGLDIAKSLAANNPDLEITVLRDTCCNPPKNPESLPDSVKVLSSQICLADGGLKQHAGDANFIVDNWSSSSEDVEKVLEIGRSCRVEQVVYLSSALNLYKQTDKSPIREEEDVDEESHFRKMELTYASADLLFTVIRSQYVYGGEQSPTLEYIVNRLVRGMHVPLPLHGDQLLSLTHVSDLGTLISATLGKSAAMKQTFNCGGQSFITYKGLCDKVQRVISSNEEGHANEPKYMYFEPKLFDVETGGDPYPLGRTSCILSSKKAEETLGWTPNFENDKDFEKHLSALIGQRETAHDPDFKHFMHDLEIIASKDVDFTFNYDFIK